MSTFWAEGRVRYPEPGDEEAVDPELLAWVVLAVLDGGSRDAEPAG
jgi:hypothetical protein